MRTQLDQIVRRTRQYWYADGIPEIAVGCLLLAVGLLFAIEAAAPPGSGLSRVTAYGLPVLILAGVFAAGRFVKTVKARMTYPRTGYVAYTRPAGARRILRILIAALAGALLGDAAMRLRLDSSQTLLLQALCASILIMVAGLGLIRFYALAAFTMGLGILLSRFPTGPAQGNALLYGAAGAAFILSGAITLLTYLRRSTPPPEEP